MMRGGWREGRGTCGSGTSHACIQHWAHLPAILETAPSTYLIIAQASGRLLRITSIPREDISPHSFCSRGWNAQFSEISAGYLGTQNSGVLRFISNCNRSRCAHSDNNTACFGVASNWPGDHQVECCGGIGWYMQRSRTSDCLKNKKPVLPVWGRG